MPSMQDKLDLVHWVEQFPTREQVTGYEHVLGACAERYGNNRAELHAVIEQMIDLYKKNFRALVREHRRSLEDPHHMPGPEFLAECYDKCLAALLLRMWTYASEHYQRWTLPDAADELHLSDAALEELLREEG